MDVAVLGDVRDTPVEHVHLAEFSNDHVVRLEVPVHYPATVRVVDSETHLPEDAEQLGKAQMNSVRQRIVIEHIPQRSTADDPHRVAGISLWIDTEIVNGDD